MESIPPESIEKRIYLIRGKKVMLDKDLAALYQVPTKALNQAVRRNPERFPEDFMFQLTKKELSSKILRSQFVTLEQGKYSKYIPYVFTEQGVAMLSSVLNSPVAIAVNIQIIRTFVNLRRMATTHQELWLKIDEIERKYDKQFQVVFRAIKLLLQKPKDGPEERFNAENWRSQFVTLD